jgi:hypothetical protein
VATENGLVHRVTHGRHERSSRSDEPTALIKMGKTIVKTCVSLPVNRLIKFLHDRLMAANRKKHSEPDLEAKSITGDPYICM